MADSSPILDSRPAAPRPEAPPLQAGQLLGDYRLLDPVGSGGFSVVWRARHEKTGTVAALKVPRVPEFVEHLRREALVSMRFQDRQVAGILEVRLDHEPPFLAMPFIEGAALETPEQAPEPAGIAPALRRFRQVAEVVARIHDAGIAHGDLKPGNLRVGRDGVCHVLDLGLARQQVAARQRSTLRASVVSVTGERIAGTLEYMAPEILAGARPEAASDVYALGVLLHAMLCGRPPAFGVSPLELNPYLPPGLTDYLRVLLHPEPKFRPASARELLPALDGFIGAEERCLRRRNGHARRLVFQRRMRTLARGIKVVAWAVLAAFLALFGVSTLGAVVPREGFEPFAGFLIVAGVFLFLVGFLLGVTTINAWILGVPEKTYKNRSGHPWWTFMMQ